MSFVIASYLTYKTFSTSDDTLQVKTIKTRYRQNESRGLCILGSIRVLREWGGRSFILPVSGLILFLILCVFAPLLIRLRRGSVLFDLCPSDDVAFLIEQCFDQDERIEGYFVDAGRLGYHSTGRGAGFLHHTINIKQRRYEVRSSDAERTQEERTTRTPKKDPRAAGADPDP